MTRPSALTAAQRRAVWESETLSALNNLGEALRQDSGFGPHYVLDGKHLAFEKEMRKLARKGLCQIDDIGSSSFVKITPAGRAALEGPRPDLKT